MKPAVDLAAPQNSSHRARLVAGALIASIVLAACGAGTSGESGTNSLTNSPPPSSPPPAPTTYSLQVNLTGTGTVTSSPSGITCPGDCGQTYGSGTSVILTATPGTNFTFGGWGGSCSGTGTCTVSMSAARTVTATFNQGPASSYTLSVTRTGSGTVTSTPGGINCGNDCSETYSTGTSVTLSANAGNGYTFSGWGGSCSGTGTCTVSMSAARAVIASFTSNTPTADLCDGLVTDKVAHPMTALAQPALGQTVTDPEFGTTIRRITAVGGSGVAKPAYSTIPAWNADESYLILYHTGTSSNGHNLYNGKTYAWIRRLNISPPDLEQFYWHATDPDILYYVKNSTRTLTRYRVSTNSEEPVHDFRTSACPSGTVSGGGDPMYMSWDSDVIGLNCSSGTGFSYRISTNTVGTPLASGGRAPVAAPSGTQMYLPTGSGEVRDLNMGLLRTLSVGNTGDHASLGRLADGTDTLNGVAFDGSPTGSLVVTSLNDGTERTIIGQATGYPYPPSGTHVSALAFKNPGWVGVSIVGNASGASVLHQEIVLANTNPGGSVCRVAHHRSANPDYWDEPHVVISPTGTRLLFGSNWGGGTSTDSYVVELPSYQP